MGTPEFAVASLDALVSHGYDVCAVVTASDKPAGRGRKMRISEVKSYALDHEIPVLQPDNLKDATFIEDLKSYQANLFIVVAFRMLPEAVWSMPAMGTFNLHASLLPQYRGAAPINRAIMDGASQGGVSTFFLQHEIDTGSIIFREETPIAADETAGEYHDRLMKLGAELLIKTVEAIEKGDVSTMTQDQLMKEGELLKKAPKIHKEDCRIDWQRGSHEIYNQIRGLSPYPGAYTEIGLKEGKVMMLKIFRAEVNFCKCHAEPGTIKTDFKNYFKICCKDACISILELQQAGKKRLQIKQFLIGLIPSTLEEML